MTSQRRFSHHYRPAHFDEFGHYGYGHRRSSQHFLRAVRVTLLLALVALVAGIYF